MDTGLAAFQNKVKTWLEDFALSQALGEVVVLLFEETRTPEGRQIVLRIADHGVWSAPK